MPALNCLEIILLILATFRLSRLLTREEGLFSLFETLRFVSKDNELGRLLSCPLCTSVWTGGMVLLLTLHSIGWVVIILLGVSGGACLLHKAMGDIHVQD